MNGMVRLENTWGCVPDHGSKPLRGLRRENWDKTRSFSLDADRAPQLKASVSLRCEASPWSALTVSALFGGDLSPPGAREH